MYIGNILGLLGDNITFTAEAVVGLGYENQFYVESINNYEINGYGDMYSTLENIYFAFYYRDENKAEMRIAIRATKVTSAIEDDIILPSTVTSIASHFFGGKSITGLGVTKINEFAFANGRLDEIGNLILLSTNTKLISVNVAENCDIGVYAFSHCEELNSFSLMNGTIGEGAFSDCYNLTTLKFGPNVVLTEDKQSLGPLPSFYISNTSVIPVYTKIIGKYTQVLDYGWRRSGRIIKEETENYKLIFQNHYNAFVGIDIESYSDGQVKMCINDSIKTARLTEDTKTKYTGLCVVADGKIYQFMDKIAL